jgi:hypothetical protein
VEIEAKTQRAAAVAAVLIDDGIEASRLCLPEGLRVG